MKSLESFIMENKQYIESKKISKLNTIDYDINTDSIHFLDSDLFFMNNDSSKLFICSNNNFFNHFEGTTTTIENFKIKQCIISDKTISLLQHIFPNIVPKRIYNNIKLSIDINFENSLHFYKSIFNIDAPSEFVVKNLPYKISHCVDLRKYGLNFSKNIFSIGFNSPFGLVGELVTTPEEIIRAINSDFSKITIDCSKYINYKYYELPDETAIIEFSKLEEHTKNMIENIYINNSNMNFTKINFTINKITLIKSVLSMQFLIKHLIEIYENVISDCSNKIDIEIDFSNSNYDTNIESCFYLLSELHNSGINISSIYPKITKLNIPHIKNLFDLTDKFKIYLSINKQYLNNFEIFNFIQSNKFKYISKTINLDVSSAFELLKKYNLHKYEETIRKLESKNLHLSYLTPHAFNNLLSSLYSEFESLISSNLDEFAAILKLKLENFHT